MDVVVAGGHGQIALLSEALLAQQGHRTRALIRNPDHRDEVRAAGAEPVLADLEALPADELAQLIGGADAVVFAAGAGPRSGPERKWTVDHGGAVKLIEAARTAGIARYVMISAFGADPEAEDDGGFGTYLRAKGQADAALAASGLAYVTIKPVGLTDGPPTGRVSTDPHDGSREIPRADVAAAVVAVLQDDGLADVEFVLRGGERPLAEALAALAG